MIVRHWMTDDAKDEINQVAMYLPRNVVEHTVNLIEAMDGETHIDVDYRCRIVHVLYRAVNEKDFHFKCSGTRKYDACHEFCLYLEGWIWIITGEDTETSDIQMKCSIDE